MNGHFAQIAPCITGSSKEVSLDERECDRIIVMCLMVNGAIQEAEWSPGQRITPNKYKWYKIAVIT